MLIAPTQFALSHSTGPWEANHSKLRVLIDFAQPFRGKRTLSAAQASLLSHYKVAAAVLPITRFVFLSAERTFLAKADSLNLICGQPK